MKTMYISVDVEVVLKGAGSIEVNDCFVDADERLMIITTADKEVKYVIPIDSIMFMRAESHNA